jgi:hypothetical protein
MNKTKKRILIAIGLLPLLLINGYVFDNELGISEVTQVISLFILPL